MALSCSTRSVIASKQTHADSLSTLLIRAFCSASLAPINVLLSVPLSDIVSLVLSVQNQGLKGYVRNPGMVDASGDCTCRQWMIAFAAEVERYVGGARP